MPISYQCPTCIHYGPEPGRCNAFPDGIPRAIQTGRHDHRKPFDGDGGIRWEPTSALARRLMENMDGPGDDKGDDVEASDDGITTQ